MNHDILAIECHSSHRTKNTRLALFGLARATVHVLMERLHCVCVNSHGTDI